MYINTVHMVHGNNIIVNHQVEVLTFVLLLPVYIQAVGVKNKWDATLHNIAIYFIIYSRKYNEK